MAHVIKSPCDAIRRPLQKFRYKHIVRLHMMPYLGVSFFILQKLQMQLIICHTICANRQRHCWSHALLFAIKWLTTALCVSCRKVRRKALHNGNVIKVCRLCTCLHIDNAIIIIKIIINYNLNSICVYFEFDFSLIKVSKISVYMVLNQSIDQININRVTYWLLKQFSMQKCWKTKEFGSLTVQGKQGIHKQLSPKKQQQPRCGSFR